MSCNVPLFQMFATLFSLAVIVILLERLRLALTANGKSQIPFYISSK